MLKALHLSVFLLAVTPAAAAAQVPAGSVFTGGSVGPTAKNVAGTSEIGLAVSPDGTEVTIRGMVAVGCPGSGSSELHGGATAPVAPDGTFSARLRRGAQTSDRRFRSRLTISGTLKPEGATGNFTGRGKARGRRACSGTVAWKAIPAPALDGAAAAPAQAGTVLLGRTGQEGGPFSFNLRVSDDGRIPLSVWSFAVACGDDDVAPQETNYNIPMPIREDGTFGRTERFTVRYSNARERSRVIIAGRFVAGGAVGTARRVSVVRSRRTGKVIDRCDTGAVGWQAAVA